MAVDAGADCVQPIGEVKSGSSEDCLFMNIWTPYLPPMSGESPQPLRPVMVYFYGGGFQSGSGKNPNTDGTNLASRGDVVVVSVNYRVGNVGFLAFNDTIHRGNYAISDMVTALEWLNRNVNYFGGDASQVTIFGESAGAQGTHILLASPKAKGLFKRAIMQSDPTGYPNGGKFKWTQYGKVEDAYRSGTMKVLNETGCLNATDQIACLGKISGFDLVNLTTNFK
jgi:carboxylesterase type B